MTEFENKAIELLTEISEKLSAMEAHLQDLAGIEDRWLERTRRAQVPRDPNT